MIISLSNINFGGGSGGGGGTVRIIDNLESTATTAALSANQGKVLGDHIGDAEEVVARGFIQVKQDIQQTTFPYSNVGTDWSSVQWFNSGAYNLTVNNVEQGLRLHEYGIGGELHNPRISEITTSETVLRIQTLTQDEYDALEQGGNLNNNTLYAIVEPQV